MLHTDETTMAEVFAQAGYATGMVGKWHLGDNAPHRPQDRGFEDVLWHRGGGIGQAADYWGNDYFDDTYERNGTWEKFAGYCTDVFFAESMRFVEENRDRPFFLYLATNAPHSPFVVAEEWAAPYRETVKWQFGPEFYGMISNFDHNLGLLRAHLEKLGLAEDTIFIFLTDNGTAKGNGGKGLSPEDTFRGFNAGMRGQKSTVYEGGHRVPFFIHWPNGPDGGLVGGRDVENLAAHLDVLPTLAELCAVQLPDNLALDGSSFAAQLTDSQAPPHRDHVVVQLQGGAHFSGPGQKWTASCVVKDQWRLVDGEQLYDVASDPGQKRNVAAHHPEQVAALRALYENFWAEVSPRMTAVSIDLGNPAQNPTELTSQDWYMQKGNPPWHAGAVARRDRVSGPWHVDVKQAGRYHITLRQMPSSHTTALVADRARITIAGIEAEKPVAKGAAEVSFELDLPAGKTTLQTWLYKGDTEPGGAYFTEVELLGEPGSDDSAATAPAAAPSSPGDGPDLQPALDNRAAWLDEDKFGLFIHWGLYSQIAKGEWYMHAKKVPIEEYSKLTETCNPTKFDAAEWVKIAKNAGMKYIVITSKHHDGFALFDSEASAYNLVDATPFKRDMIAELKEACDAEGIKLGLYYSHAQDWYQRGGASAYNWTEPSGMDEMKTYLDTIAIPQVREILSQYDPAIIWYDTPRRMSPALAKPFFEVVREISPDTLINSRIALDGNKMGTITQKDLAMLESLGVDYLSYADREIPAESPWPHWESCMTLNGAWGFTKGDESWKSPSLVIKQLLEVVSKGGAFLLNVGPDAEGRFPPESVAVLEQVGRWLEANGDAVYGAEPVAFNLPGTPTEAYLARKAAMEKRFADRDQPLPHISVERDFPWIATRKADIIHITFFTWPGTSFEVADFKHEVKEAFLSSNPEAPLTATVEDEILNVILPEHQPAGELPSVLRLVLGE